MGDQEGDGVARGSVTMDDLKRLETTLTSSMETQMREMREMIMQLMSPNRATPPPPSEDPPSSPQAQATAKLVDLKDVDEQSNKGSPSKRGDGKGEYSEVPHWYSPDPPIPHPHINNRGDPPSLSASSSFVQWQFLMTSHVNSSSIELWRIIKTGLKI